MMGGDLNGGAVASGHRAMWSTSSFLFSQPQRPAQLPERPRVDDIISRQPAPAGRGDPGTDCTERTKENDLSFPGRPGDNNNHQNTDDAGKRDRGLCWYWLWWP